MSVLVRYSIHIVAKITKQRYLVRLPERVAGDGRPVYPVAVPVRLAVLLVVAVVAVDVEVAELLAREAATVAVHVGLAALSREGGGASSQLCIQMQHPYY